MPLVVAGFAAFGTALGATAATAVATGVAATATVASIGATAYSTVQQKNAASAAASDASNAANSAAATTQATADYNARVDRANEEQISADSAANIDAMRRDAKVYLSRQTAAYAGAGVSVDSGSPLAVRVSTAGALALREAEVHRETNARLQGIESAAKAGVAEGQSQADAIRIQGQAQSDAYHRAGSAALLNGASRMLSQGAGLYQAGAFSGAGGAGAPSVPKATPYNTGGFDSPSFSAGLA